MNALRVSRLHNNAHRPARDAHDGNRYARRQTLRIGDVVGVRFAIVEVHNGGIGAAQIQIDKRQVAAQVWMTCPMQVRWSMVGTSYEWWRGSKALTIEA